MRLEELTAKALDISGVDRYQLAIAVAARAEELLAGSPSKINIDIKTTKATNVALMELAAGLVRIKGFSEKTK